MAPIKKKGRGRPRLPPPTSKSPIKKKKRKQWTEESMVAAIIAARNGTAVLLAANEHGVPRNTLQDRILGKVVHGTNPGPRPYLEPIEENELSNFLVDTAKAGFGKPRKKSRPLRRK